MRQSMASLLTQVPSFSLDKKNKTNTIGYADLFDQTGYGFIGGRSKTICKYTILI